VLATPLDPVQRKNIIVFLLHGMGDDCTYPHWHWIEELTLQGYSVFSFDWDGHGAGNTSMLDFRHVAHSVQNIIKKATDGISQFNDENRYLHTSDHPRAVVLGHSTGASIALECLSQGALDNLVSCALLISPALSVSSFAAGVGELMSYTKPLTWLKDFAPAIPTFGLRGMIPAFGKYRRNEFPIRLAGGGNYVDEVRNYVTKTFADETLFSKLTQPLFWVHGKQDKVVPYKKAFALLSKCAMLKVHKAYPSRSHIEMVFSLEPLQFLIAQMNEHFRSE
jgi:alpha-beta hydrolase superfamily lysophospholipase